MEAYHYVEYPELEFSGNSNLLEGYMKTPRFTEFQIISVFKQANAELPAKDICRQADISATTYYTWKSKCGDLDVSELSWVKVLESANSHLKRMYAKLALDNAAMQDFLTTKI